MKRTPWPHQTYAFETAVAEILACRKEMCITSPTGSGKSLLMQMLCEWCLAQGKRVAIFTNRRLLTTQLARGLNEEGFHIGVRAADFEAWTDPNAPIQVCSTPTEAARVIRRREQAMQRLATEEEAHRDYQLFPADVVLVDECFVGGTMVSTIHGDVRIEAIRRGDFVHTASGIGQVENTSCRSSRDILRVEFDDGTEFTCTSNHRVFTRKGWTVSRLLEVGDVVYGQEELRGLRSRVSSVSENHKEHRAGECDESGSLREAAMLLAILLEETEEPDGESRCGCEDEVNDNCYWPQAASTRREWPRDAADANGSTGRIGRRVDARVGCSDKDASRQRLPVVLQAGYRECETENRNRSRREQPRGDVAQTTRCKKDGVSCPPRVVRVSRVECNGDVLVYNLHVSGHPSYFANGKLVHNCHMNSGGQMRSILQEYREKFNSVIIGITATPLGIGDLYKHLIVATSMSQLRACGALVPAICFEPMVMDLSKVYKSKHELPSQSALEKATQHIWTQHIVGAIYDHWKEQNPDGKQSVGFAPGVAESLGMAKEFWARGVNAAHISGVGLYVDGKEYKSTKQEDRDEIFARSKSGEVPMIWNRFTLREAVDLPWLECAVLACPIGSVLSYIQTIGRVLRASPSTGKTSATVIDHAGNCRLHGSPNMNRDEQWLQYFLVEDEEQITKDKIDRMRDPENKEPEPITCPKCGAIRNSGPTCTRCGHEHETSIRHIMQEDGKLVQSKESFMPKKNIRVYNNTEKLWTQCYFRLKNSKKRDFTFSQVRALFVREHHYWPPEGLPFMPKHKSDWSRKIKNVSPRDLVSKDGN